MPDLPYEMIYGRAKKALCVLMLLLKYAKIYELCEASLSPRFNHFGNVGFFSRLFKGVSEKWLTAMWNKSIGLKTKMCSIVSVTGYFYGIAFSNKVSLLVKCIIESMHSNGMWDGCLCVYLWKLNIALFQFYLILHPLVRLASLMHSCTIHFIAFYASTNSSGYQAS